MGILFIATIGGLIVYWLIVGFLKLVYYGASGEVYIPEVKPKKAVKEDKRDWNIVYEDKPKSIGMGVKVYKANGERVY